MVVVDIFKSVTTVGQLTLPKCCKWILNKLYVVFAYIFRYTEEYAMAGFLPFLFQKEAFYIPTGIQTPTWVAEFVLRL